MILSVGMAGEDVGTLQQQLIEAGYDVPAAELASSSFGAGTEAAVRQFQAAHHVPVDGVVGPITQRALEAAPLNAEYIARGWRCEPSEAREAVRRVLQIAVGELGVHEEPPGSNRGPRVDQYTTPDLGVPWCAAFLSWTFQHGCDDGSPFGRILSAYRFHEWAQVNNRLLSEAAIPQAGDCFLILRGGFHGHVGLIVGTLPDGRLCTVEGNSADCVRGLVRSRASVTAVARPVPLM